MKKWVFSFFVLAAVSFGVLGFLEGQNTRLEENNKLKFYVSLSNTYSCVIGADARLMHFVNRAATGNISTIRAQMTNCWRWLENTGRLAEGEGSSQMLGEATLFLQGFSNLMDVMIKRQVELEILYNKSDGLFSNIEAIMKIRDLEMKQQADALELENFAAHLEQLIVRAW